MYNIQSLFSINETISFIINLHYIQNRGNITKISIRVTANNNRRHFMIENHVFTVALGFAVICTTGLPGLDGFLVTV